LTTVLAAALAGCSGASDAGPPPPGATSTGVTGDPVAAPSDTPSASDPPTAQVDPRDLAAKAAVTQVQIMYAEYNLMLASGLADRYRATYARACSACTREAQRVLRIAQRGQHIVGGICTVSHLHAVEIHSKTVIVRGRFAESAALVMDGHTVVNRQPAIRPTTMMWTLSNAAGRWLVYQAKDF
jgi:hypothetical protein